MAEVYQNNIVPRFTQIQEDVHRIYKRVSYLNIKLF